jgi:hypothetical protein
LGNEEDGHLVSDLEETLIHDVCQEEHSTRFYCPRPDLKAEVLLGRVCTVQDIGRGCESGDKEPT